MTKFEEFLQQRATEYARFDPSGLAPQFVDAFNSGSRVEVEIVNDAGEIETTYGHIGVTTGWKPVFLLLLKPHAIGSVYRLTAKDRLKRTMAV